MKHLLSQLFPILMVSASNLILVSLKRWFLAYSSGLNGIGTSFRSLLPQKILARHPWLWSLRASIVTAEGNNFLYVFLIPTWYCRLRDAKWLQDLTNVRNDINLPAETYKSVDFRHITESVCITNQSIGKTRPRNPPLKNEKYIKKKNERINKEKQHKKRRKKT